jgi:hypothetical protein
MESVFLGDYKSTGALKESYDALCIKHNDMTYNRKFVISDGAGPRGTSCLGVDFLSIDIVSDADFDAEHIAGVSLSDIVKYRTNSYKPYIESGYTLAESHSNWGNISSISGFLSEIVPTDPLYLLGDNSFKDFIILNFNNLPTLSKTHTFTVTMTADDGRIFTDSIEMTFE